MSFAASSPLDRSMQLDPSTVLACPGEAQPCGSSSTALKWGGDGELSDLDRDRILRLLAAVDPVARELQGQAPEA